MGFAVENLKVIKGKNAEIRAKQIYILVNEMMKMLLYKFYKNYRSLSTTYRNVSSNTNCL